MILEIPLTFFAAAAFLNQPICLLLYPAIPWIIAASVTHLQHSYSSAKMFSVLSIYRPLLIL
jgi:hypothetical protein